MNKNILLTISILISNRPDTVRKCLDSIQPLLEQVPSELILVDTGCGEQVRAIIEEYTDKIIEFEWCRDFSKARNAGLKKARGQWFLFLDDDEWFEDVEELIAFFRTGEYKGYGLAVYTQRNYLEKDGSVYTDLLVGRMIKLEPDTKFVYRIHECFNRVKGKTKKFNAYVHHYGYVYASPEESRAHSMRNISLLLEEHAEDPGNLKHVLQLAQEYNVLDEYDKSLEISLEAIELSKQGKINNEYFLSSVMANEIGCYMDLDRFDEAIEKGEYYLSHKKPDKMVKGMIAGHLAVAYRKRGEHARVLEYAGYYWRGYQDYLENEESFLAFVTTITNKCFEEHNRSIVLGHGIHAAAMLGQGEQAWQWFDSFDWKAPQIFASQEMIKAVAQRIPEAGAQERTYYVKMCNILMERTELEGHVLRAISDCCKSRESLEERVAVLAAYEGVKSEHWFFKLREIVVRAFLPQSEGQGRGAGGCSESRGSGGGQGQGAAESESQRNGAPDESRKTEIPEAGMPGRGATAGAEGEGAMADGARKAERPETGSGDAGDLETLAMDVWEHPDASMSTIRTYSMLEAVERLGGDNGQILEKLPFYLWKKGIAEYFKQFSWEDADWWNGQFAAILPGESVRLLAWRALYGLAGAVKAAGTQEQDRDADSADALPSSDIKEALAEYASCQTALCERLYRPEIIAEARDMLPEEYQGAYLVTDLLAEAERKGYAQAVGIIKEIKRILPGLTDVMRPYLHWIDAGLKRQEQESRQAVGEFQVLARQIKRKIHVFLEAGQHEAALTVAKQLQALLPEDEEIRELIERLS